MPHTPVHLGSMDRSVASVIAAHTTMQPGDVFVTNAPYNGGTHLPDITVVTPVFGDDAIKPLFFVASRGHHADIGGIAPGSMTPLAVSIEQEGVLLDNAILVKAGVFQHEFIENTLKNGRYPCRNRRKILRISRRRLLPMKKAYANLVLVANFGLKVVLAYMGYIQDYAENCIRNAIRTLKDGHATVNFDQGCKIVLSIACDRNKGEAIVDFAGTSGQQADNFNAPAPVTRAAVLYAFRCMVDENIPINAGCMRPITLKIPDHSMLSPQYPAAVVAGNVEVSQAVTDCLFAAMGAMAGAQGTMNNFNFGNDQYQYYETICGGSGAGPNFHGAHAVHTHMTNTRLTDPEILETRYPVILRIFIFAVKQGGMANIRGVMGYRVSCVFAKNGCVFSLWPSRCSVGVLVVGMAMWGLIISYLPMVKN